MTPEQDAEYDRLCSIVAAQEAAEQQGPALRSSSSGQKASRPQDKGKEKIDRRLPDRATFPQNDVYDEDHAADMQALLLYEAEEEERERRRRSSSSSEKRRRSPEPSTTTASRTEGLQQKEAPALHHAGRRPNKKPRLSRKSISALVDVLLSLATDEDEADSSDGGVSFSFPSPFSLGCSPLFPPSLSYNLPEDEIYGNNRSS